MSASCAELGISWTSVSASSTVRSRASSTVSPNSTQPGLTAMTRETSSSTSNELRVTPVTIASASPQATMQAAKTLRSWFTMPLAVAIEHAVALLPRVEEIGVALVVVRQPGVVDFEPLGRAQPHRRHRRLDAVLAADQHRRAIAAAGEQQRGADRLFLLALGEDDALRLGAHPLEDQLEPGGGRVEPRRATTRL